jgi:hypothetical protein
VVKIARVVVDLIEAVEQGMSGMLIACALVRE